MVLTKYFKLNLEEVLKGTGVILESDRTVSRVFGDWSWEIPEDQVAAYKKAVPVIKKRLTDLYDEGVIRYASWGAGEVEASPEV